MSGKVSNDSLKKFKKSPIVEAEEKQLRRINENHMAHLLKAANTVNDKLIAINQAN